MIKKFNRFINEGYTKDSDLKEFLSDKEFINPKSKMFLYHGTDITPENFELSHDYEPSHDEYPPGYLFLSTEIREPLSYGRYAIPVELKRYDHLSFKVYDYNPSRVFDMDYGIDLYMPDEYVGFWEKFEDSGKSNLVIKGYKKWTVITDIDNIIPRIDLATEYYNTRG